MTLKCILELEVFTNIALARRIRQGKWQVIGDRWQVKNNFFLHYHSNILTDSRSPVYEIKLILSDFTCSYFSILQLLKLVSWRRNNCFYLVCQWKLSKHYKLDSQKNYVVYRWQKHFLSDASCTWWFFLAAVTPNVEFTYF